MGNNGQRLIGTIVCLLFLLTGCKHEGEEVITYQSNYHWVDKTIAVVAPIGDEATAKRLNRTADWFCENFFEAQLHDTLFIRLNIEWHDELTEDLQAISKEMARRDDIAAIIGPFANNNVATFASACQRTQKAMIAPTGRIRKHPFRQRHVYRRHPHHLRPLANPRRQDCTSELLQFQR